VKNKKEKDQIRLLAL